MMKKKWRKTRRDWKDMITIMTRNKLDNLSIQYELDIEEEEEMKKSRLIDRKRRILCVRKGEEPLAEKSA